MSWKENVIKWANKVDLPDNLKVDLEKLKQDENLMEDAFYKSLEFGTAGMRGVLGAGTNRMNIYTVRQVTEALAQHLDGLSKDTRLKGVAIAYDSRHYSSDFGLEAAKVLANHNIKAYLFDSLRSTPELSFAVRELKCDAGIMITASHNPSSYNGYKLYGSDGGQMAPEAVSVVVTNFEKITDPFEINVADENSDLIEIIGEEIDTKYLENLKTVTVNSEVIQKFGKDLKIVYTPLHGAGLMIMKRALENSGFDSVIFEPKQSQPDGDFSTVPSPNPEEPEAFELAMLIGEKEGADVLVATDPDADRMGVAVKDSQGEYRVLTGNQIAALLVNYLLQAKKESGTLPENGVVLKSIVSSELPTAICKQYDIEMMNVLTGFKFIAEKIEDFEENKDKEFIFGFEESYGYLVKDFVRDKDAIQATLLLAEVAAYYKAQSKTLYDGLIEIFGKYGYFSEKTISVTLPGIEGSQKIKALMDGFRSKGLSSLAGVDIIKTEDYLVQKRTFSNGGEELIDLPTADVLKYTFSDSTWMAIRPSGTEPKIKFYIGVQGDTPVESTAKISKYENEIQQLIN